MKKHNIKTIVPQRRTLGKAQGTAVGMNRKQITLVMTEWQFSKVESLAKRNDLSFAAMVRQLIDKA
jgi:hypothetical protein